ncbi:DUF4301 family protein [Costertonia aggregata]|uniref:DUF4301 family protein n=1 Tax=Costertonia aggregata TaxID=343403 RepID=A0A7H9AQC8_9FLAO|nr:DUF4301 family protein [Costertonia aggregata]QLG45636.1 DUF4301 family protein [Costertonia aggregata]
MEFTNKDLELLQEKGIDQNEVKRQIETFKEGIPFVRLSKSAVVGDGILKFSPSEEQQYIDTFEKSKEGLLLLKFVPASGAASRMFKAMFNFLEAYDPLGESLDEYVARTNDTAIKEFFEQWEKLAFYKLIQNRIVGKAKNKDEEKYLFVKEMLLEDGLNYGFYPKGLLPFHEYGDTTATPFEEHLKEAAAYATVGGKSNLHFTISEQHGEMFNEEFNKVGDRVSTATKTSFTVGYSFQKSSTDTIAVDMNNDPFRNSEGTILFRPGGHGALIENLDEQDADIIFIKNIDNVVTPRYADDVSKSKKILAGLLLSVQQKAFEYARALEGDTVNSELLNDCKAFLEDELNVRFSDSFATFTISNQIDVLKDKLHRPIRICGMVKNEGEPGGGPFWIKDGNGRISLQIVESAQIDLSNSNQSEILKTSTHFNPVDIVCGVKDYEGDKYNLLNYVDPKQGFITEKTKEGKALKALERPGLWNGAMAYWNTIFVEVPSTTFNPVKTVNDLLKPAHQVK